MTTVIIILAFLLLLFGILGGIIPGLPGPPISYVGILLLHFFTDVHFSTSFLWFWGLVVAIVFVLDYTIQAWGVKKFGGGRKSTIGTFVGLFAGLFFFPPIGLVVGPFVGAFIGALAEVKGDNNRAMKVAFGSFLGFVSGSLLKVIVSVFLLGYSIYFWFYNG